MDVDAFPLVDLRDCHALIEVGCGTPRPVHSSVQTTSEDQTKPARHNNLTTRNRTCTGWRFVMEASWSPRHTRGSRQDIHSTRVSLRRKAVDGPSHLWHTWVMSTRHSRAVWLSIVSKEIPLRTAAVLLPKCLSTTSISQTRMEYNTTSP